MATEKMKSALQISGLTAFLICLICVLFICAQNWVSYRRFKGIELLNVFAIVCFGVCAKSSAFYTMFDQCDFDLVSGRHTSYCDAWIAIWIISWRSAIIAMMVLYISRLKHTFDHLKKYQTPQRIYRIFYASNSIFWILGLLLMITILSGYAKRHKIQFAIITILSQVIQFTNSFFLIKLYLDKLFALNAQAGRYLYLPPPQYEDDVYDDDEDSDSAPELSADILDENNVQKQRSNNPAQIKILSAISKITVLSVLAVASSEIVYTFQAVGSAAGWFAGSDNDIMEVILWIGWDVDVVINSLCLFLSFDFNDRLYQRWCYGLHRSCMFICDKCSRRKRKNATNDLEARLLSL